MEQSKLAEQVISFLQQQPAVRSVTVIGSLQNGTADAFSDIDLEVDVSGTDNGVFALQLPDLLSKRFDVLFYDYAPSLAPEKYVVTVAIDRDHPFHLVDIGCIAVPHYGGVSKQQLEAQNERDAHLLKLFAVNLKHFLRGKECRGDILRMYGKLFGAECSVMKEMEMLRAVYQWLTAYAGEKYSAYIALFAQFIR